MIKFNKVNGDIVETIEILKIDWLKDLLTEKYEQAMEKAFIIDNNIKWKLKCKMMKAALKKLGLNDEEIDNVLMRQMSEWTEKNYR